MPVIPATTVLAGEPTSSGVAHDAEFHHHDRPLGADVHTLGSSQKYQINMYLKSITTSIHCDICSLHTAAIKSQAVAHLTADVSFEPRADSPNLSTNVQVTQATMEDSDQGAYRCGSSGRARTHRHTTSAVQWSPLLRPPQVTRPAT